MKIGIFGGTFNPIHYGHLRSAEEVREKFGLDKILFVPAGSPPLKTEGIADALHRQEMLRLAVADNKFFELSDIECRLPGKSYSVNTVEQLKKADPDAKFFFILGIDAFIDIPNWWQPEILITLTDFIIISRPEFRFIDLKNSPYLRSKVGTLKAFDNSVAEAYITNLQGDRDAILFKQTPIGISSTEVRSLIKHDRSIKYLLPPEVQSYIITNKLYRS